MHERIACLVLGATLAAPCAAWAQAAGPVAPAPASATATSAAPGTPAAGPDAVATNLFGRVAQAFTWSENGQLYLYGTGLARTPDSAINPGNATVRLPNLDLTQELRPNVSATSPYLDVVVQPRLAGYYQTGDVPEESGVRGYLLQGFARAKPTTTTSITAGREVLTWGPAIFRSPSNPFYFNNARLNPIRELSGLDVAHATAATADGRWSLTAGDVFGSGHDLVAQDAYRGSLFAKLDYVGTNGLASVILDAARGDSLFAGSYAQATVSDAALLYGEVGASSSDTSPSLVTAADGTSRFVQPGASHRSATALAGGSYTFPNGHTLFLEYLYNGFGYTSVGERAYWSALRASGAQTALGGSVGELAEQGFGYGVSRSNDLLGRHYVYAQYQNDQAQGGRIWRVMASHNLLDHSTQFSGYGEVNVLDRVSLFALGTVNAGSKQSEFGALFRESLLAGVKVFLF